MLIGFSQCTRYFICYSQQHCKLGAMVMPIHIGENRTCPRRAVSGVGQDLISGRVNSEPSLFTSSPLHGVTVHQLYCCQAHGVCYPVEPHVCGELHWNAFVHREAPGLFYPPPPSLKWGGPGRGCLIHLPPSRSRLNLLEQSAKKSNITIYFMGLFLYLTTLPVVRLQAVEGQGPFLLLVRSSSP